MGKPIGSDAQEKKNTYMTLLGGEECQRRIEKLNAAAKEALNGVFEDTGFLYSLADSLAVRRN